MKNDVTELNELWTDIYYVLRYKHDDKLTHVGVRILQVIQKETEVGIQDIAKEIGVSHNTASEHVKRLTEKQYIHKTRSSEDERKVILQLTDFGKEVLHRNSSLDEEKLKVILDQLSPQKKENMLDAFKLLKKMADTL